jgi:hypothetical protein
VALFRSPLPQWIVVGGILGAVFGAFARSAVEMPVRFLGPFCSCLAACFAAEATYLVLLGERAAFATAVPLELVAAAGMTGAVLATPAKHWALMVIPGAVIGIAGLAAADVFLRLY